MKHFRREVFNWRPYVVDLFISDDRYEELFERLRQTKDDVVDYAIKFPFSLILDRSEFDLGRLCDLRKNNRVAILNAHGEYNGQWYYYDGSKCRLVQEWVDKHDSGKYVGLLAYSCNSGNVQSVSCSLTSKRTVVFYPDNAIGCFSNYEIKVFIPPIETLTNPLTKLSTPLFKVFKKKL